MSDDLAAELLALEQGFWGASTDPSYYEEHVAEEAVMIFPYGVGPMDKRQVLYTVGANAEGWDAYELSEVHVVPLCADAALITYRAVAERGGDDPFEAFVASAYVRANGDWLLVFHQQTLSAGSASGY